MEQHSNNESDDQDQEKYKYMLMAMANQYMSKYPMMIINDLDDKLENQQLEAAIKMSLGNNQPPPPSN